MKNFYNKYKKGFDIFFRIVRTLVFILGILWGGILIGVNVIGYETLLKGFAEATDTKTSDYYAEPVEGSSDLLNDIYADSYEPFFVLSGIAALLGTLILSRGRNIWEIMGLFLAFAIPRQRKYWGVVYDQHKNMPITFASISVVRTNTELHKESIVATAVTDLDGRYRIHLEDKTEDYVLRVKADGYHPYEKVIDYKYQLLIQNIIIEDIPLTKLEQKPNIFKRLIAFIRPKMYTFTMYFIYLVSFIAFIWAIYGIIVFFFIDSVIFLILYSFGFFWNTKIIIERLTQKNGKILDSKTKQPIVRAMIRVFDDTRQVLSTLSQEDGTVKIDLPPAIYTIKIDKENYEFNHYGDQDLFVVKIGQEGYISKDIYLDKVGEAQTKINSKLMNPFS